VEKAETILSGLSRRCFSVVGVKIFVVGVNFDA
jgi:hypothetical protein